MPWPSLSKPAARPNGEGNVKPNASVCSEAAGAVILAQHPPGSGAVGRPDALEADLVGLLGVHPGEGQLEECGVNAHGPSFPVYRRLTKPVTLPAVSM